MARREPDYDECLEALEVMIETYGYTRTKAMLETAKETIRKERESE